jgi:phosphonate transport system substrate-binding protein
MAPPLSRRTLFSTALPFAGLLAACGSDSNDDSAATATSTGSTPPADTKPTETQPADTNSADTKPADTKPADTAAPASRPLRISAIPDQDPEKLNKLYGLVGAYLAKATGVEVEYVPVTDYAASVSLFRAGDLDFVWFGGLTGVQARLQTDGAIIVAQRDIDENFKSVFVGNSAAGFAPIADVSGLSVFKGRRFTFGSESSTSGRLMPQYFLDQAGIGPTDFEGEPGFSGSHDKTVDLVAAGAFEAGALNEQVWRKRIKEATVDTNAVQELFVTPGYHDYHWILNAAANDVFGDDIADRLQAALTGLDPAKPDDLAILDLYGAKGFIPSEAGNYAEIEEIGRKLGLITE